MRFSLTSLRKTSPDAWIPWVALLPIPAWFAASALLAAPAAWRATYIAAPGQPPSAVEFEREMSHIWYGKFFSEVPGGVPGESFIATFETCLSVDEESVIPVMLAAEGKAELLVDGSPRLSVASVGKQRAVEGNKLQLQPGSHHVRVQFEARKRPSVGLLASFDGRAPRAVGSGNLAGGVRTFPPATTDSPCGPTPR